MNFGTQPIYAEDDITLARKIDVFQEFQVYCAWCQRCQLIIKPLRLKRRNNVENFKDAFKAIEEKKKISSFSSTIWSKGN